MARTVKLWSEVSLQAIWPRPVTSWANSLPEIRSTPGNYGVLAGLCFLWCF